MPKQDIIVQSMALGDDAPKQEMGWVRTQLMESSLKFRIESSMAISKKHLRFFKQINLPRAPHSILEVFNTQPLPALSSPFPLVTSQRIV